jgi:hypothetical protein
MIVADPVRPGDAGSATIMQSWLAGWSAGAG